MDLAGVDLSRILVVVGPMFAGPMFAGPMFAGPQDGPQDGPRAVIGGPAGLAARMRDLGAHALVGAPGTTSMTSGTETVVVDGDLVSVSVVDAHLTLDGVKVDVIPTEHLTLDDLEDLEAKQRLFLGSHRWALESTQLVTAVVVEGRRDGRDSVECTVPVATPVASVAMKLQAIEDRLGQGAKKICSLARPRKTESLDTVLHQGVVDGHGRRSTGRTQADPVLWVSQWRVAGCRAAGVWAWSADRPRFRPWV